MIYDYSLSFSVGPWSNGTDIGVYPNSGKLLSEVCENL